MTDKLTDKTIDNLTTAGVLFLTLASFILSYDALRQLAVTSGVNWYLSWLYPFTFDAVVVVSAVSMLRATIKQDSRVYAWLLVVLFTVLSVGGNVLHLDTGAAWYAVYVAPWLRLVVFAMPPVALALVFHLLIMHIENDIKRRVVDIKPDTTTAEPDISLTSVTPEADKPVTNVSRKPRQRKKPVGKMSQAERWQIIKDNRDKTQVELAALTGVTPRTISRDIEAMPVNGNEKY